MVQKQIREWGGQQYSLEESVAIFKELDDRTKSDISGYNSINEIGAKVKELAEQDDNGNPLLKPFGYDWIKGAGNEDLQNLQIGDELKRVGTLFPDRWVHLYITALPLNEQTKNDNVIFITFVEI